MRILLYDKEISATYTSSVPSDISLTLLCQLYDAESLVVKEELNGSYELEMVYVATGINADQIAVDLIIGVLVPMQSSIYENYFRIYRVEKDLTGRVYVYARHISSDTSYVPVRNNSSSPSGVTTLAAWITLLRTYAMNDFPVLFSDEDSSTLSVSYKMPFKTVASVMSYIGGEDLTSPDKSMLDIFGGEIVWDQFTVKRYNERGTTRTTSIAYGSNMDGIEITDDLDEVYTSYVLYYADDQFQVASDEYDTDYEGEFGFKRVAMIDWTYYLAEAGYTTQAQILSALNTAAATYRDNHNLEPSRQITVNVVSAAIDDVYLGDYVPVIYRRHNEDINTTMKIVGYEWDVLMQRYNSLTLGAVQDTLAKEIAATYGTAELASQNSNNLATLTQRVTSAESEISTLDSEVTQLNTNFDALFIYKQFTYTYSLAASTSVAVTMTDLGYSVPSGYTGLAVYRIDSGNSWVAIPFFRVDGGSTNVMRLSNTRTTAVSNAIARIYVIFVKSDFITAVS